MSIDLSHLASCLTIHPPSRATRLSLTSCFPPSLSLWTPHCLCIPISLAGRNRTTYTGRTYGTSQLMIPRNKLARNTTMRTATEKYTPPAATALQEAWRFVTGTTGLGNRKLMTASRRPHPVLLDGVQGQPRTHYTVDRPSSRNLVFKSQSDACRRPGFSFASHILRKPGIPSKWLQRPRFAVECHGLVVHGIWVAGHSRQGEFRRARLGDDESVLRAVGQAGLRPGVNDQKGYFFTTRPLPRIMRVSSFRLVGRGRVLDTYLYRVQFIRSPNILADETPCGDPTRSGVYVNET